MAIREIVTYGHPALHHPAEPVEKIDDSVHELLHDMVETMLAAPGVGLAAPQIGVGLRVIVVDLSVGEDPSQLIQLVNPEIVEAEGQQKEEEGCLSVPGYGGHTIRPARVTVRGLDPSGEAKTYTGTGLLARAFSHEIDHIEGRLFVDRLSPLKRDLLKRKLRKKAKTQDWGD
jgi:peptide deformylase